LSCLALSWLLKALSEWGTIELLIVNSRCSPSGRIKTTEILAIRHTLMFVNY
jgi:hypothetical protein